MAFFYLTDFIGSGTEDDPYRPRGSDAAELWTINDLTNSQSDDAGVKQLCFLGADRAVGGGPNTIFLGNDKRAVPGQAIKAQLRARLRLDRDIAGATVAEIIRDVLENHGDHDNPAKWNPIRPGEPIQLGGEVL